MFDAETVERIKLAPALDGLDPSTLPKRFTDAYLRIVTARMRLREGRLSSDSLVEMVEQTTDEMRRLAFTFEAFVAALPSREDRASSAFVAATAHHVVLLAENTLNAARTTVLTHNRVAPEVSATLLFLIAEAAADAAEMSKAIVPPAQHTVESELLNAVRLLATGKLNELLRRDPPEPSELDPRSPNDDASSRLYYLLLLGIRSLASTLLDVDDVIGASRDARLMFDEVVDLSVEPLPLAPSIRGARPITMFTGPRHMASLLRSVASDLLGSAVTKVAPPGDLPAYIWTMALREIAKGRPYLWRNHRNAIDAGYLERGTSSVITFPTGAGKSTLAELRIAASVLRGEKVVFLAPTLALVDQTARALKKAFPNAGIREDSGDEAFFELGEDQIQQILVLTPERCLTLLSFNASAFESVGLLVFDECHLLHPRDSEASRRAVDAMLCVLNFSFACPDADMLFLSAMVKNTAELADWLKDLTGRRCLALELPWKPTRQARGCLVYESKQIQALNSKLRAAHRIRSTKGPPVKLQREMVVTPSGLFSLLQAWQSKRVEDYALLPLLDEAVKLSISTQGWHLTPNGNKVAASLAAASARRGIKTLVFTQTIPFANSTAKEIAGELGSSRVVLTSEERRLYDLACEEFGGRRYLYIEIDEEGTVRSSAVVHHGLLLPAERRLHESLFKRRPGVSVAVATSTLSQGMNLPSEAVIIASDGRFDANANRMQQVEAHELLNAAGRAGRAGESSYGFVLIVPSQVIAFDDESSSISRYWSTLQGVFSQSDQCISIEDPLVPLLDQIHQAASTTPSDLAHYLVRRLPAGARLGDEGDDTHARRLLGKSLGAFQARRDARADWYQSRLDSAISARNMNAVASAPITWADRLVSASGLPALSIKELGAWVSSSSPPDSASVMDWIDALFAWFAQQPAQFVSLVRPETLGGVMRPADRQLENDEARGRIAIPILRRLLVSWVTGGSLSEIEQLMGGRSRETLHCEGAREFVLRVVPELAYLFALPAQIDRAMALEASIRPRKSLSLEVLAACVKEGFDFAEKLALHQIDGRRQSRVATHKTFAAYRPLLEVAGGDRDFAAVLARVREAKRTLGQQESSGD